MRKTFESFFTFCDKVFVVLANGCLAVMLIINTVNILSRALFGEAISWVFSWSMVLFIWMVFLGFYIFNRKGRNISVDLLMNRLSGVSRKTLCLVIDLVTLLLLGVILYTVPENLSKQVGELEMVGLQRYTLSIPFFVSCTLLLLNKCMDITGLFVDHQSAK